MSLKKQEAQYRSKYIRQNSITYLFNLLLEETFYISVSEIKFTLDSPCDQFFIDCTSQNIRQLVINDSPLLNFHHVQSHLYLDMKYLKVGTNILYIQTQNQYNNDERGLLSFTDVDSHQYLYTAFEPYYAHRVFALFDQPDLKASMVLSIVCPYKWDKVLSNQYSTFNQIFQQDKYLDNIPSCFKQKLNNSLISFINEKDKECLRMALFPPTKIMPTYTYGVIVGPYIQIKLDKPYNNIPMSLYCSVSYFPSVQKMAPYLFQTTVQSMRFCQQFFGFPYSFGRYDQIFVHEMQTCAMENTGIVTYHDVQYIWKNQTTHQKALDLADTMVHQLSHHWFGNLVSIYWWDDLWLKESFAQFIGYYVLEIIQKRFKIVQFQSSYAQFLIKKSQRAYFQDRLINTHSIGKVNIDSTGASEAIFDGITYVKGASVLKQLTYLMGQQNLSKGLQKYFTKYAFKNASYQEFFTCIEENFKNDYGIPLEQWRKAWIESPSFNSLEPVWEDNQQRGERVLKVLQRPHSQQYQILRPHKIKVALFKEDLSYDVIQVFIQDQGETIIPLNPETSKLYRAVFLNFEDHTFAKIILDPTSLQFFQQHLVQIQHVLTRTHIWRIFYDMVTEGSISSLRYIDLFERNIREEKSDTIAERNFQFLLNCIYLYTPQQYRTQLSTRMFYLTLDILRKGKGLSKDRQITLKSSLCKLGSSQMTIKLLYRWYRGQQPSLNKYSLPEILKWQIIQSLITLEDISVQRRKEIVEIQFSCDRSKTGVLERQKCLLMLGSEQRFLQVYHSLFDQKNRGSLNQKKHLIQALTHGANGERLKKIKKKYFADLKSCSQTLDPETLRILVINLQPIDDKFEETIQCYKQLNFDSDRQSKLTHKLVKLLDCFERRKNASLRFLQQLSH